MTLRLDIDLFEALDLQMKHGSYKILALGVFCTCYYETAYATYG